MFVTSLLAGIATAAPLDPSKLPTIVESYTSGPVTLDTDTATFGPHAGQVLGGVVIFNFGELTIGADLTVTGSRPVALLSRGDLTVLGQIDLSAAGSTGGPGGDSGVQRADGEGLGFGRVGSGGSGAGHCGTGGDAVGGDVRGGDPYGALEAELSGGSSGGSSSDPGGGVGAGGGGALELGALGRLVVNGAILADGASAGLVNNKGAGGGGSGGSIFLHGGRDSSCGARLSVRGGSGGDSRNDHGGGGGGGGCILALGVDVTSCQLDLGGGDAGNDDLGPYGATSSFPGGDAESVVVEDPDFDGDGVTIDDGDCNDLDAAIRPGAEEVVDGVDNDCDGVVDPQRPDPTETGDTGGVDGDTAVPPGDTAGGEVAPEEGVTLPGYQLCSCDSSPASWGGLGLLGVLLLARRRSG